MKKIKLIIISVIIYIGLILINTQVYAATEGKTKNDSTRIRQKASTSSETVVSISKNKKVEILGEEGEWYKVKYKSNGLEYEGYIRNDLLSVAKKEETKTEEKKEETVEKSTKVEENVDNTSQKVEIKEGNTIKVSRKIEIRILPLINSSKVENISKNSDVTISEILGNWCYVESDKQSGWVIKTNLENNIANNEPEAEPKTEEKKEEKTETKKEEKKEETKKEESKTTQTKKMYISSKTVNLRREANTTSEIMDQLLRNTEVTVIEKVDNTWSKVKIGNLTGYISTEYLSNKKVEEVSSRSLENDRTPEIEPKDQKEEKKEEKDAKAENKKEEKKESKIKNKTESKKEDNNSVTGAKVVEYAKKYLGHKYVYGTAGPDTFDCSGFTSYVYKHFGYSLSRTSGGQRSNGKEVKKANLKAGDLVCFSGHVGIYIGGNNFIHAANPKKGIIITSLSNSYYKKITGGLSWK